MATPPVQSFSHAISRIQAITWVAVSGQTWLIRKTPWLACTAILQTSSTAPHRWRLMSPAACTFFQAAWAAITSLASHRPPNGSESISATGASQTSTISRFHHSSFKFQSTITQAQRLPAPRHPQQETVIPSLDREPQEATHASSNANTATRSNPATVT